MIIAKSPSTLFILLSSVLLTLSCLFEFFLFSYFFKWSEMMNKTVKKCEWTERIIFVCLWGHTWLCLGLSPGSAFRNFFRQGSGDHIQYFWDHLSLWRPLLVLSGSYLRPIYYLVNYLIIWSIICSGGNFWAFMWSPSSRIFWWWK